MFIGKKVFYRSNLLSVKILFKEADKNGQHPDALIVVTASNQQANVLYSQNNDLQRYNKNIKISGTSSLHIASAYV